MGLKSCFTLAMTARSIMAVLTYLNGISWDFGMLLKLLWLCAIWVQRRNGCSLKWNGYIKVQKTSLLPNEFAIKYVIFITKHKNYSILFKARSSRMTNLMLQHCFSRRVGLQRSFPTPMILWFFAGIWLFSYTRKSRLCSVILSEL